MAIDGPLLVIAGPGTGKTQLLSVRVAHILTKTDIPPQNILCLTFTESGAENMRERLTRFIGKAAYDVNIGTYHAFGGDLIRRYPEVFAKSRLQKPADNLAKHQIISNLIDQLPYDNPLKQTSHHLGDVINTISEVKRALLSSDDLRNIAKENTQFLSQASNISRAALSEMKTMPRKAPVAIDLFQSILDGWQNLIPPTPVHQQFGSLANIAVTELQIALENAAADNKTKPLTEWKNKWLSKNAANEFICNGQLPNKRLAALADVFDSYEEELASRGWYDFDDMILRAVEALRDNLDLRYTLQEQYQYILLDEFQDTNNAQFELVRLLCDNPVNEGRPNVMAVGDDDQAIYAFQGAQYSNMVDFYKSFTDVKVVCLTQNYRSSSAILQTAHNIASQISERLTDRFDEVDKKLLAVRDEVLSGKYDSGIERRAFQSDIAQYDWIAGRIKQLINDGTVASEIAVLSPKHEFLEELVPYLSNQDIPVRYEKREDILQAPVVLQLLQMSRLVLALAAEDETTAASLWKEVLSYEFWKIPVADIWKLSWTVRDSKRQDNITWSRAMLDSDNPLFSQTAELFMALAAKSGSETCEKVLDYLIGSDMVNVAPERFVRSPLRHFYTSPDVQKLHPELFYETISHLTELRSRLREYQATRSTSLGLKDLIDFVDLYQAADERMQSTSPYNQHPQAIQLMSVFKAKGLEFDHVFLPHCQDTVWGGSASKNPNKLTLPTNLAPIRHAGANEDERLRILFVALTRAKHGLHLASFETTYSGKATKHLKFFDEQEQEDGSFRSLILPEGSQSVVFEDHQAPLLEDIERSWQSKHLDGLADTNLHSLLADRLVNYQLSPTHLNKFIDVEYAGPDAFFFDTLLNFPQAPSVNSQFGDMIHETLEWVQLQMSATNQLPRIEDVLVHFGGILGKYVLSAQQQANEQLRGEIALRAFLEARGHMFKPDNKAEQNFKHEGVFIGDAHMAGKIDHLEIDHKAKKIAVIDFKTGRTYQRWASKSSLYKYELQLYCYKLLVENSHTYKGYTVTEGRLEFVEPDDEGQINHLALQFSDEKTAETVRLIIAMWDKVQALDFPDTSKYGENLAGMKEFVKDLLSPKDTAS